jgi:outer membrane protein TolC
MRLNIFVLTYILVFLSCSLSAQDSTLLAHAQLTTSSALEAPTSPLSVQENLTSSLSGQQVLTLERSREMALKNNKQMAIAAEGAEMAGYNVKAYKSNFLPKISATGNYLLTTASLEKSVPGFHLPTYIPDASGELVPNILTTVDGMPIFKEYAFFPGMDLSLKPNGTYIASLRVEMPIYMGGKISSAYNMSKIGKEMARLNEMKTRNEVIMQVDVAYWTYVETLELAKTASAYNELVEQLVVDVANAYHVGMVPRNDLLKVQVKLNEVELQLLRAENGVRLARMNLCHIIGLPLNSEVEVDYVMGNGLFLSNNGSRNIDGSRENEVYMNNKKSKVVPLPDLFSRPEYELLSKQIELKERQVKLAKSDFLPSVGIAGNMGYANGLKLNDSKLLDNTAFSAVVNVSIPLFHWGEGRNKVRSAMAEKRMASLQREELTEKMELEIQQALQAYSESEARVVLTKRSLNQAEENLRESGDRYESGLETLSNLMEAQAMWQQAHSEVISANSAYKIAETAYLKAAGRLEE